MHSKVEEAWGKGRLGEDRIGTKVYNCIHQVFKHNVRRSHMRTPLNFISAY